MYNLTISDEIRKFKLYLHEVSGHHSFEKKSDHFEIVETARLDSFSFEAEMFY
ncbi:MAG: hypothetical protein ACFFAU_04785 [Candidatus Hodarchaeota archaeon]